MSPIHQQLSVLACQTEIIIKHCHLSAHPLFYFNYECQTLPVLALKSSDDHSLLENCIYSYFLVI